MKVGVTGGSGLLGTAFSNHSHKNIEWVCIPGPQNHGPDLLDREQAFDYFNEQKFDAIVHAAAKVGGIKSNIANSYDFFTENIRINNNTLDAAKNADIKRCISFLSTCIYPDETTYPLTEENIHKGEPHPSNYGYAYAKRMLDIHSRSISSLRGYNYTCVVPNNIYGINDNFHLENSHVIPGIISKVKKALDSNKKTVKLWGDGSPKREFTFADDVPEVIAHLLSRKKIPPVINIGNVNREYTILEVANDIISLMEADIKLSWNSKAPNGQDRKPSCDEKIKKLKYDSSNYTDLRLGLKKTISWFLENYPNVRGID